MVFWSMFAFLLGLAISFALVRMQQHESDRRYRAKLEQAADSGFAALHDRLEQCALLIRALQTMYVASREVSPDEFVAGYDNLRPRERFPSLQAFAHAARVAAPEGDRYITRTVAPFKGNERLIGLDIARQPSNLFALRHSRDSNEPALSAPFRLAQFSEKDPRSIGVALRLPVFSPGPLPADVRARRLRTTGSLAVSFSVAALVANALPADTRRWLHVQVDDVTGPRPLAVYRSAVGTARMPVIERKLVFAGRTWRMSMHPVAAAPALDWKRSLLVPGLVASALLALLVGSVVGTREHAHALGRRMSQHHRESEARFRAVSDLLPALVLLADGADGRISYANQASRVRLGASVDRLYLGELFEDEAMRMQLTRPGAPACDNIEAQLRSANGDRFWANVSIASVELDGEARLLVVATDVSEQRQLTELLSYQASHDTLTDLYNRRAFERHVDHALAGIAAGAAPSVLLFVDLDQFKLINDTSGHSAGDQLLIQLSAVMRDQLRGGDVLARLGGDEFGVLAAAVNGIEGAHLVAERLCASINAHVFVWEQRSYTISASIGAVMLEHPQVPLKEWFTQADTACYLAKEAGRNRVHFYLERDDAGTRRRNEMEWANRLRWAVDEGRFVLYYQEVMALLPGQQDGGARLELLLRFREEDGRIVTPGAFMPAAERYGLMPMIDRWVIETALSNFDRLHPSGAALQLATINLSGASIEDEALGDFILELLQRHRVDPKRVCFEITETVAVRSLVPVTRLIERLRAIGCRIALDDFGAGMSSFGYLKSLPADIIKIDGSFIQDLLGDSMSRAIVRAVTDIGHERGFLVVAEWVASHAVGDALAEMGVDYGQGFGLHRPQPVSFQRGR